MLSTHQKHGVLSTQGTGVDRSCAVVCWGLAILLVLMMSVHTAALAQQPPTQSGDDAQVLSRQAEEEFTRGDYAAACADFRSFAQGEDASALAWSNYGVACHMAGQTQEAVAALEKALRLDAHVLAANLILGIDYIKLERPREAVPLLKRILEQQPDNRDALLDLAAAQLALHETKAATDSYRLEVSFRPKDPDAWYGMGISFEHIAEEASRQLSSVAHDSSYFHRLVGSFLLEQGLFVDAQDAFRKAIAASSRNDVDLHAEMGFAFLRAHKLAEAADELNQEIAISPRSPMAKLGLAALELERSKFSEAVSALCDLYQGDKAFFVAHIPWFVDSISDTAKSATLEYLNSKPVTSGCPAGISLVAAQLRDDNSATSDDSMFAGLPKKATAIAPLKTSLALAQAANQKGQYTNCVGSLRALPHTALQGNLLLARCASLTGRYGAAFDAADAASAASPSDPAALYWRAESARKLAKASFARAVSINPESWQGKILLGDLFRQRRQWDAAISRYDEAVQLKPELPAPHLGLAAIYWETGQFEKAQPELQRVLQLDPENVQAKSQLADILVRQHHFEEALPLLLRVAEVNPDLLLTHANLGKVFAHEGKVAEAVSELQIALPSDTQGELHYQLASLYRKQGKSKEAQEALAESQRLRDLALQQKQDRLKGSAPENGKAPD